MKPATPHADRAAPLGAEDLERGARCSALAVARAAETLRVRAGKSGAARRELAGTFSTLVQFGQERLGITSDGIGTKIELAERLGRYRTLGYDLVAMVADDLAANGIEPTSLSNILDVDRLDERVVDELMLGLSEAAASASIALTGGEIAELGSRVCGYGGGMHFNWSATAIGILPARLAAPIGGSECAVGDAIVAIAEEGLRSNGFTVARAILATVHGDRWHAAPCAADEQGRSWGELLLTPSRICCRLVTTLLEGDVVPHGIAHITGGGIPSKLGRVLGRAGLGAELDRLPPPPPFIAELAAMGALPEERTVRHWNMGQAMMLVVAPCDVPLTLEIARAGGYRASEVGTVAARPTIRLWSGPSAVELPVSAPEAAP